MKLQSVLHHGVAHWGIRDGEQISVLTSYWPDLAAALAAGLNRIKDVPLGACQALQASDAIVTPPIVAPRKILCVGLNYRTHVAEAGRDMPPYPSVFPRFVDSFVGHQDAIWRPNDSDKFDFEGELAVVIGKGGRHIAACDAMNHIAGYTCMAENSVRDFQKHNTQVTPGKNFERSGSIGPWLVTADEIPDPTRLRVITRLNGDVMQDASVADLIYPIPVLIEYLSRFTPLSPGDVIATGTPAGVGSSRKPPCFMRAGDRLEVDIEGVGCLQNTVIDEPLLRD